MVQPNDGLNTARAVANNGQKVCEATTTTGIFFGFQPHKDGCKVSAVTMSDKDGNTIDETNADIATWINTTVDLDSFMGAHAIPTASGWQKGYITSITLSSGAATLYLDTFAK